jgi:hypothetical protein
LDEADVWSAVMANQGPKHVKIKAGEELHLIGRLCDAVQMRLGLTKKWEMTGSFSEVSSKKAM